MPTQAENRRRYDRFTLVVSELCTDRGIRVDLRSGRGRPVDDCQDLHRHLSAMTAGRGQRRAYYTTAALIALADPPPPRPHEPAEVPAPPEPAGTPAPHEAAPEPAREPSPPAGTHDPDGAPPPDPHHHGAWARRPNLGATLATAVLRAGYNEARTDDALHLLARLGDDQLHRRLPSLVNRLLGDGLRPDWAVLLDDLVQRGYERGPVATRWLDSFYRPLHHIPKDLL